MNKFNSKSTVLNSINSGMNKSVSIGRKNSVSTSRKFPAKSQTLLYEVHLKELYQKYPKRPCRERVLEVFKIFGK